jgi:hypothetical protein
VVVEENSSDTSTIAIRCDQRCGHGVDEELGALGQRGAGVEDRELEEAVDGVVGELAGAEAYWDAVVGGNTPGSLRRSRGYRPGALEKDG